MGLQSGNHQTIPELVPLQNEKERNSNSHNTICYGRTLLLRYLRGSDWLLLFAGTFFALSHGLCFPLVTMILGHMTDILLSQAEQRCNSSSNATADYLPQYEEELDDYKELSIENLLHNTTIGFVSPQQLLDILSSEPTSMSQEEFEDLLSLLSAILGGFVMVAAFLQPFCWDLCSSRRVNRLRLDLFNKLLHQEMIWYDKHKGKDITSVICRHIDQFGQGTGSKLGMLLQYCATCLAGFIVALIANWRLTLFIFPLFFLCLVVPHILDKVYLDLTRKGYAEAGDIAEDVFGNSESSVDADDHGVELNCYREALLEGQTSTLKRFYAICTSILALYLIANAAMAIALWQNWKLIEMGCLAPGAVATVFFSVIGGMLSINKVLAFASTLLSAKKSAAVLRGVIDDAPSFKNMDKVEKSFFRGKVQFEEVNFSYPADYKNQMINNINFEIGAGQSFAFLDINGKAPTTIMDLLLGFYEPSAGKVLFDGKESCPPNVVAVISFDPKLFTCLSVLDNIQLGLKDIQFNQVVQVALNVGVHGYIPSLSLGYDTPVGNQFPTDLKQRIALARVAIREPKILIVDDITSQYKMEIQGNRTLIETFHKVMDGCTTLVLSQRLHIIQHANMIYVLENGILCEKGSFADLMTKQGPFHGWVNRHKRDQDSASTNMHHNGTDRKPRKMSEFAFEAETVKQKVLPKIGRCSLVCLGLPDWPWLMFGLFGHICTGLGLPAFARLFGDIFVPREELPRTTQVWGFMVIIVGAVVGISFWLQSISIVTSTERLLNRLRMQVFSKLLQQADENIPDKTKLTKIHSQLTRDLPSVRMVTASRICEIIGASTSLIAAMVAAFLHGWKMELVLLLVFPALALVFHIKTRTLKSQQEHQSKLMMPANNVMSECIEKIRTLRILGGEETFINLYAKKLIEPYHVSKKHSTMYAVVYALAESGVHVLYAASFKFGFFLIRSELMGLVSVYRIFFALGVCIISMSQLLIFRQEWAGAQDTLQGVFELVEGTVQYKLP